MSKCKTSSSVWDSFIYFVNQTIIRSGVLYKAMMPLWKFKMFISVLTMKGKTTILCVSYQARLEPKNVFCDIQEFSKSY